MKSLVNAVRLKPYYDPEGRPTNPPDELQDNDDELDPEELENNQLNEEAEVNDNEDDIRMPKNNGKQRNNEEKDKEPRREAETNGQRRKGKAPKIKDRRQYNERDKKNENKHETLKKKENKTNTINRDLNNRKKQQDDNRHHETQKTENRSSKNGTLNIKDDVNRGDQQRTGPTHKEPEKNKSKNENKPSCRECQNGNCSPFRQNEIKEIMSSSRSNGALYYKIKFRNNTTAWHFSCKIPQHLIREYHANRTMTGRKRRKPLNPKQHKFFNEVPATVQTITENQINNEQLPKLLGLRVIRNRIYYSVQQYQNRQAWFPVQTAREHAQSLFIDLEKKLKELLKETEINALKERLEHSARQCSDYATILAADIQELQIDIDGSYKCLVDFQKRDIPPEWKKLEDVPFGLITNLLLLMKDERNHFLRGRERY